MTMNRPEGISESDLIDAMCLTWRHDFWLPAPSTDANGRMAWSDGFAVGMTQQERDGLRLQMRQLYEHHIKPAVQSSVEAERAACADRLMAIAKATPLGHENIQRGKSTYNWLQYAADLVRKGA